MRKHLERLDKLDDRPMLIAVAAFVGKIRLIDNIMLNGAKKKEMSSPRLKFLAAPCSERVL